MERFHGKVVLISGGARGQGAAEAARIMREALRALKRPEMPQASERTAPQT